MPFRRPVDRVLALLVAASLVAACSTDNPIPSPAASGERLPTPADTTIPSPYGGTSVLDAARQKIKHVVVVMQENRSFDSYFGTYPGADGIPMHDGKPTICVPDPKARTCDAPYHDPNPVNVGGPHHAAAAVGDVDRGKMDGFIKQAENAVKGCQTLLDPACSRGGVDVMGFHDRTDIPNYWAYADQFVLEDHMFEPNASWSLPEHLFLVSEWSAKCSVRDDPMSCENALDRPRRRRTLASAPGPRSPTTPGRTSPPSSTGTASAGRGTCFPAASRTARTARRRAGRSRSRRQRRGSGTRCPGSPPCARTASSAT